MVSKQKFLARPSVVSGQRSAVSGQWSAVSGQRSVVTGHWSLVSGQRSLVSRWPLATLREQPLAFGSELIADS
ncbi:MAG: hypothetical protein F6K26_51405 [Moorea sp. SIO2I5]|nr:hypothetical protein [Moorena sp. SIO2I5]